MRVQNREQMHDWSDKIRQKKEQIRKRQYLCKRVASIMDKMRENRQRWFEHEMCREETEAVRAVMKMNIEEKIEREKPKNYG